MITQDLIEKLELDFPKKLAQEWDNVGLILGDRQKEIKKIQLSLDATQRAIENAKKNGVDMIVTHHPFIFKPLKNIDFSTSLGEKIKNLVVNDINVLSLHTNLDSAKDGLNDYILSLLEVTKSKVLDRDENYQGAGIGRVYKLEKRIKLIDYIDFVKEKLEIKNVRIVADDMDKEIQKIALVNGSGASYWKLAKSVGADLFITGDVGYHEGLDALESNFILVDIGHFEGEKHFAKLLKSYFENLNLDVIIYNDGPVFESY